MGSLSGQPNMIYSGRVRSGPQAGQPIYQKRQQAPNWGPMISPLAQDRYRALTQGLATPGTYQPGMGGNFDLGDQASGGGFGGSGAGGGGLFGDFLGALGKFQFGSPFNASPIMQQGRANLNVGSVPGLSANIGQPGMAAANTTYGNRLHGMQNENDIDFQRQASAGLSNLQQQIQGAQGNARTDVAGLLSQMAQSSMGLDAGRRGVLMNLLGNLVG